MKEWGSRGTKKKKGRRQKNGRGGRRGGVPFDKVQQGEIEVGEREEFGRKRSRQTALNKKAAKKTRREGSPSPVPSKRFLGKAIESPESKKGGKPGKA